MRYYAERPCEHGKMQSHRDSIPGKGGVGPICPGGTRTELRMAALTKAFDDAAAEDGVQWNPNLGPILKRARELSEDT